MKSPKESVDLPLEYASAIAWELHLMRGECSTAARQICRQAPLDEQALEETARLDESLARAHRVLHTALTAIRRARAKRKNQK
jgi:hypothetical protein